MNIPPETSVFTRREALAMVARSAAVAMTMASSATLLASTLDVDGARAGSPPLLADEAPPPFVLSF